MRYLHPVSQPMGMHSVTSSRPDASYTITPEAVSLSVLPQAATSAQQPATNRGSLVLSRVTVIGNRGPFHEFGRGRAHRRGRSTILSFLLEKERPRYDWAANGIAFPAVIARLVATANGIALSAVIVLLVAPAGVPVVEGGHARPFSRKSVCPPLSSPPT